MFQEIQAETFEARALALFRHQAEHAEVYKEFLRLLGKSPQQVERIEDIPCLPVSFFKTHLIQTGNWSPQEVFSSSSTGGQFPSRHLCRSVEAYIDNTLRGFNHFYQDISQYAVLALLPAYLEREGSSLVLMADAFIKRSLYAESGFFLYEHQALIDRLQLLAQRQVPTLLIGVSFALWDLAERGDIRLAPEVIVMETGGMKGRRRELIREELHAILRQGLGVSAIHSEYGMTELSSQAYSLGDGRFRCTPDMRVLTREVYSPMDMAGIGKTGLINVIDLANADTCAFIATDDLGRVYADGSFEVLGRMDNSDIRGCNLMANL